MTDRPSPNTPWWWLASAGVAGVFFSLLWAVDGSAFLQKDWSIASRVRFLGAGNVIKPTGFSSGPLSALYFSVTHSLVGHHPATHVLLLAALNGVVAALVLVLGARLFGRWTGFWAAAVWVALPNRASTRLWVSTAPAVLSLALVLLGVLLLHQGRRRLAWVVLAAGVLAHWATAGVALAAVGVHVWRARRAGVPALRLAVPAALVVAALAVTVTWSSRGHGAASVGSSTRYAVAAQFGSGTFGPLAWGGGLLVMAAILVALGRAFVPGFPGPPFSGVDRAVLAGAGLVAAGVVPFLVAGYPTGTGGLVDQANLVAGLGTALILGALLAWVVPQAGGAGLVAAAVAVAYVAAFNTADLRDYRRAVDDGNALLAQLHADLPDIPSSLVVGPPLPDRNGVAQFAAGDDLGAALRLRRGEPGLRARIAVSTKDFESAGDRLRYDWTLHTIVVPRR